MRVLDAASGGLPYRVPYPDKAAAAEAVSETPVAEESPAAAKPLAAEESSLESDLKRVARMEAEEARRREDESTISEMELVDSSDFDHVNSAAHPRTRTPSFSQHR